MRPGQKKKDKDKDKEKRGKVGTLDLSNTKNTTEMVTVTVKSLIMSNRTKVTRREGSRITLVNRKLRTSSLQVR